MADLGGADANRGVGVSRDVDLDSAVVLLRAGEVVGLPTETVYGLAADGSNESAVRRVFAVKGRPAGHPVILHVADPTEVDRYASHVPAEAERLIRSFWPGPLTLVLSRSSLVPDVVTGGLPTVGLRMPAHPIFLEVAGRLGRPLAAPSANRFGRVSPTRAEHVRADFGDDIPLVLDGGACTVGLESTIVDLTGARPRLRRPGGITQKDMLERADVEVFVDDGAGLPVPGSLPSHYAPRAQVLLASQARLWDRVREAAQASKVGVLHQGAAPSDLPPGVVTLRVGATEQDLAHELYAALRSLDEQGVEVVVSVIPDALGSSEASVGEAVRDRLQRAAAPRL